MLFVKSFPIAEEGEGAFIGHGGEAPARFTSLLLAEIASAASAEQMQGFFLSVGQRLAVTHPIDGARDLERLTRHANQVWHAFHWGHVQFEMDDEGIDIFHQGLPVTLEGDQQGLWAVAGPLILQGAYDGWFRQAGSGARLRTSIHRQADGCVELRHGI